jgi:hypothetical protein
VHEVARRLLRGYRTTSLSANRRLTPPRGRSICRHMSCSVSPRRENDRRSSGKCSSGGLLPPSRRRILHPGHQLNGRAGQAPSRGRWHEPLAPTVPCPKSDPARSAERTGGPRAAVCRWSHPLHTRIEPEFLLERLRVCEAYVERAYSSHLGAVKTVRPALAKFYNSLSDE